MLSGCVHWLLTYNEHAAHYMTIRDYLLDKALQGGTECEESIIAACEQTAELYTLQVYEITPIGFSVLYAPSYDEMVRLVSSHQWPQVRGTNG